MLHWRELRPGGRGCYDLHFLLGWRKTSIHPTLTGSTCTRPASWSAADLTLKPRAPLGYIFTLRYRLQPHCDCTSLSHVYTVNTLTKALLSEPQT